MFNKLHVPDLRRVGGKDRTLLYLSRSPKKVGKWAFSKNDQLSDLKFFLFRPQGCHVHGGQELPEVEELFLVRLVAEDPEDGVDEGHRVAAGKQVLEESVHVLLRQLA